MTLLQRPALATAACLAAACIVADAGAAPLRLCVVDTAIPPLVYPDRDGTARILVSMAARRAGIAVDFTTLPAERCRQGVRDGLYDGGLPAAVTPANTVFAVHPERNGRPDARAALGTLRVMVFRRHGSTATWDGERFHDLHTPVLMPTGYAILRARLQSLQVGVDEGGRDVTRNFTKLLARRSDLALATESQGRPLLDEPAFVDEIEMLPRPFLEQPFFLFFSRRWHAAHAVEARSLWDAIAQTRETPEYQAAVRHLR